MSEELADLPILEELGAQLVAGFRRREARRWRPTRRAVAVAAIAATVFTVMFVTQLTDAGLSPSEASAAQLLRAAANAAAKQPTRILRPNQFFFTRYLTADVVPVTNGGISPLPISAPGIVLLPGSVLVGTAWVTTLSWGTESLRRFGRGETTLRSVRYPSATVRALAARRGFSATYRRVVDRTPFFTLGPIRHIWLATHLMVTTAQMYNLPRNPRLLFRRLFAGGTAARALGVVETIDSFPIPPSLEASVYRALALVRGVRAEGSARALTGRAGIVLGAPEPGDAGDDQVIIDPTTGDLLGERIVANNLVLDGLPAGTIRFEDATIELRITNSPWPPKAKR
jgi:hypothetical protein